MIRSIVRASLRLSVLVMVAVGVILAVGIIGSGHASVDTLPEFLPTQVRVQTEALGLSAAEVEQFITVPLEDEFNGVPYVDSLRSRSVPGLSAIDLTFKPGTDIYTARQLVTERVAQGPSVVNVGTPPVMLEPLSSESRVMMIGLSSMKVPLIDLSTMAFWRIRPRLLSVPGVANVAIWGQRDLQLQVLFDPVRAAKAGVSLEQVINTAGDSTWTSPLSFLEASSPGADGLIDMPNQRITIQHVLPIQKATDLAQVPVEDTEGRMVRLGDVATVVESHPPLRGDAVLGDGTGLILVVQKLPGANTLSVTRGIETAMADLESGMTGVSVNTTVFRPATYIETLLKNVGFAALAGFLLLAAWLGISTRSWRVALIGVVAIAVPIVAALMVLYAFGATFNAITLAGLVMALGLIVDDAVVGARTLRHHLEQHRGSDDDRSRAEVICESYVELRRPLGWAVAIILLAVLPLLLLNGVAGSFATPTVIAYSLAVLASTAAALVITPVLANFLFRYAPASTRLGSLASLIERRFDRPASWLTRRPIWAYVAAAVLLVVGLASLSQMRASTLIPPIQDRNLLIQWQAAPGTSLTEMDRITEGAGRALRSTRGIRNVASHVGQALLGDQVVNVNSAETWITLDPNADYASTLTAIRQVLGAYPGVRHTLLTYPEASLDAAPTNTGKAVTVRLYGTDQKTLATEAEQIRQSLWTLDGVVVDPKIQAQLEEPSVQIQTDIPAAARYGLKPGDIRRQTAVLIAGIPVGSFYHDEQIFDVTVWSQPGIRDDLTDVANLLIETPSGGHVPLKDIARVTMQSSMTEIDHDRASRFLDVTADIAGRDFGSAVRRVSSRVGSLQLPLGYHAEVFSEMQDRQSADLNLWLGGLAAVIAIFLLMQAAFRSWGRAVLLFVTLPLAAVGVAPAALLTDRSLTLGVMVGLVLVLGVAVRNGILLIRSFQRMEEGGGDTRRIDLVLAATKEAAPPVVIAAVAIVLALLPFVVRGDIAGMEILRPLGSAVIGGLVTSTLLTLVILPALYLRFVLRSPAATDPQTQGEVK